MAHPSVAQQLVDMVRQAGARRIYGVVGDSLNPIVDAVRRTQGIEWVHVSNEEGGAFAAAAEAQVTGELAVCAGSCGPGNTHLLQGLYDAHRSGAPVLAIASHIQSPELGLGFFQETHPERTFQDCSHWCEVVTPKQMPQALRVAIQTAVGKRGVSVVVLPGDLAAEGSGGPTEDGAMVSVPSRVSPAPEQVRALGDALNAARTVTLFCGAGCRGAHDQVMELAGSVQAPVGHALGGQEWIQYDNPYDAA
jgi:pyruvate dehydrogenase (quinone)